MPFNYKPRSVRSADDNAADAQSRQHPASEESRREFSRHADMLDSLASLCCSEDIKLYLVLPPVHRSLSYKKLDIKQNIDVMSSKMSC